MSIARDLSLKETRTGLRLVQQPSEEIKKNLFRLSGGRQFEIKDQPIKNGETELFGQQQITGNAYWMDARLEMEPGGVAGFKIAQRRDENKKVVSEVIIGYDAVSHQVIVDRSSGGNGNLKKENLKQTITVSGDSRSIRMEILFDKSSLEIFINNGERVLTTFVFPDKDAFHLSAFSKGEGTVIKSLKIWDLSEIKQQ
jgi:levanase/fructan beta-fructosidase